MPKKLSSAVVGTLAVGLTLPATAAAAQAVTAPVDSAPPQPLTGSGESVSAASLSGGVNISTARTAETFSDPLAGQAYTYSTGQGPRCISLQGASTSHQGQDLLADEGTPFSAVSDGTVVRTVDGTPSRAGFVVLRHNIGGQVYHSGYLHVWDAESHVSVGDSVQAGQTIGVVGDSGPTVAPHLHLEIWKGGWHTGTLLDPAEWLAERGVDLREGAEQVQQREVPSTCDYYAAESTPLRASSSADAAVLTQLPRGAELTSAPGDSADGFVRVTGNGQTGWVQLGHLTPDRPSASAEPAGSDNSGSAADSQGQYRVTEPLYARSGPGTNHDIRQGMPTGEQVTVTATSGDWMQFTRRGEQVWSHGAYLERVGESAETSEASSSSDAEPTSSPSASDSASRSGDQREVTAALNVRSGAGTSNAVVGGMPAGEQVTALSTSGDWVQIRRANGQQGWVHGAYLSGGPSASSEGGSSSSTSSSGSSASASSDSGSSSSDASSSDEAGSTSGTSSSDSATHRVTVGLNLRSGAGSSHAVVGGMPAGEEVTALSTSGDWVQVRRANGQQGWAHGAYLSGGSPSSSSSSSGEADTAGGSPSSSSSSSQSDSDSSGPSRSSEDSSSASHEVSTNAWVNMRSGAGVSHGVQRTVAPSTGLEILDQSRGWYQVKVGENTGWIWQDYLDVPDSAAGQPSSSEDSSSSSGSSSSSSGSSTGSSSSSSSSSSSDSESGGSSSSEGSGASEPAETDGSTDGSTGQSAPAEESEASSSDSGTHRVTAGLNLRSGAGISHAVVGGMTSGERVDVVSTSGDWLQVRRANGQQGWAHGSYLAGGSSSDTSSSSSNGSGSSNSSDSSSSSSSSGSGSAPSSEGSSDSGSSSGSSSSSSNSSSSDSDSSSGSTGSSQQSSSSDARTTSGVNMRSGAGMSHGVTRTVAGGTGVEILGRQGGWYQVRAGGNSGWIWEDFLDVPGGSSGSSGSSSSASSSGSGSSPAGSPSSDSDSSDSGSDSADSGGSSTGDSNSSGGTGGSNGGGTNSSSGRSGPSSGQHAQSSHGPYSSVWDRLAQCESGGNWSINTGNGYYGGVQFSESSWGWVGGSGLPHQASKQEQIERAYALWQRQGWNAWPSCTSQLNLSGDPGGWGDSYFDVHGGTESASTFAAAGQWTASYSVPLREEASTSSDKLAQIPRGAVLDAGERSGSWIQVQFTHEGEELTGWVNTRYVTAA